MSGWEPVRTSREGSGAYGCPVMVENRIKRDGPREAPPRLPWTHRRTNDQVGNRDRSGPLGSRRAVVPGVPTGPTATSPHAAHVPGGGRATGVP